MDFKIVFPAGYQLIDELNDNIDINIVLKSGEVYFGVLFTISNIQYLLDKDNEPFFWSTDMLVVKDLSHITIKKSITLMLEEHILEEAFSKIGTLGEGEFYKGISFDDIADMATGYEMGNNML